MCAACEGAEAPQPGIPAALIARARKLERARPGARVADEAWCILGGDAEGAIAWADHLRMLACIDQAAAQRFFCDEA
jgi:hypothetical protein